MKAKLGELNGRWDTLKAKASQRRQDLEDSLQAQQYFADANEAESWMREKEPIVASTDYGKDEDSAEVEYREGSRRGVGKISTGGQMTVVCLLDPGLRSNGLYVTVLQESDDNEFVQRRIRGWGNEAITNWRTTSAKSTATH